VFATGWSPDGTRIVSAGRDEAARVWDLATGQESLTLQGHTELVQSVAWSPSADRIVSGSGDHTVRVWDAATGKELHTLRSHTNQVRNVTWSRDGSRLASCGEDGAIILWDPASGNKLLTLAGHNAPVRHAAWSPDGKRLASAGCDKTVKIWDTHTGMELLTLRDRAVQVGHVAWHPDGMRLAAAPADDLNPTILIWDARPKEMAGRATHPVNPPGPRPVTDPQNLEELNDTGDRSWVTGRVAEAEEAYRTARRLSGGTADPADPRPEDLEQFARSTSNLSLLLEATGRTVEAAQLRLEARQLRAGLSPEQRKNMASRYRALAEPLRAAARSRAEFDNALNVLGLALELKPDAPELWGLRGLYYSSGGRHDQAIADFSRVVELNPLDDNGWHLKGMAYARLNQLDKALADWSKAVELAPTNATYLRDRAGAYAQLGRWQEALADFRRAVELPTSGAADLNNLAWQLATSPDAALRQPARAVELARKAVKLAPNDGNSANTLGAALYRAGSWQEAIAALEKSLLLSKGGYSTDYFFLAMAHCQLGNHAEARRWYDRAVQWMDKNAPKEAALLRFRAEAEEVLGVK
jgi:tetratricopeptide (TPR) repeat protein